MDEAQRRAVSLAQFYFRPAASKSPTHQEDR